MDNGLDQTIIKELDRLYRFMYRRTHDAYRAEDLTHDVILTAYRIYPEIRDKNRIVPWLWGIARNIYARSRKPCRELLTDETAIIDIMGVSYATPESEYLKKDEILNMRRAVSFLAKNYRDVCVMFWLEGKDYNTISEELGIPLSSVKWRLNQSKERLREEISRMDYMEKSYHRAIPLTFKMGGYSGKWDPALGNYDNADKALDGLLPQNICLAAYETPKTVTEISSELGVAADYVEEALDKLSRTGCVRHISTKYQTMFPIWDAAAIGDVFDGNIRTAESKAGNVIDLLLALEDEIKSVGFCGCDKGIEKLLLFLIGYVCHNTEHNTFETDKLPFKGDDKAWYILAAKEKEFCSRYFDGNGINSTGSSFGLCEYYFYQKLVPDNRSQRTEEKKAFYNLFLGETVTDDYSMARLVEAGKVKKDQESYTILVPVLNGRRGELKRLNDALAPVLAETNSIQADLYARSCETVKKYIPKHISCQAEFFGGYCSHSVLETVLFEQLMLRGIAITADMATWYTIDS